MVDVDRLLATPLAVAQGWKKRMKENVAERPMLLPPNAHKLVRAISADLNTQDTKYEITLLEMPKGLALNTIADRHKGYVEEISNVKAVWLPEGAYCVKLTDDLLGVMFPANRQFLSRWIRERSGQAADYLTDAARDMKAKGPQLLVAIDLDDAVSPGDLEDRLKKFVSLGESEKNLKAITKVVEGIRGVKFGVTVDTKATGRMIVNFDSDVAPLKSIAKPLLLEVLSNRGMALDELDDWEVTTEGRQLIFSGPLTDSGLMRLSSLFELPSELIEDSEANVDADNPMLYATQAHYKAVQKLLDDILKKPRTISANTRSGLTATPKKSIACRWSTSIKRCRRTAPEWPSC